VLIDWLVLHDQPVPGRHRNPVLGDQEARNGADATGEGQVHLHLDLGQQHKQLGTSHLLCGDRQIYRSSVATLQETNVKEVQII